MSKFRLHRGPAMLGDSFFPPSVWTDLVFIITGAAFVALGAQVTIPLGEIPITAQTVAVLAVGMTLGALRGTLSLLLYIVVGLSGVPVFSGSGFGLDRLIGPLGGFLIGLMLMATVSGWVAQRGLDRTLSRALTATMWGTATIYGVGLSWYLVATNGNWAYLVSIEFWLLFLAAVVKAILVAIAIAVLWHWAEKSPLAVPQEQDSAAQTPW